MVRALESSVSALRRANWRLFRDRDAPAAGMPAWGYVALFAFCMALGDLSLERYNALALWPANGVLIAAILMLPSRRALAALAVCAAINVIGNILRHDPALMVFLNVLLNFGEASACALLVRRFCGATLDLRRPLRLARFSICVVACVLVSGAIGCYFRPDVKPDEYLYVLGYWVSIETLGVLVTAPTLLLLARAHSFADTDHRSGLEKAILLGALALVTAGSFATRATTVEFFVFVPLLVTAFRLPPHWTAIAVVVVASISSFFSLNGWGPFTLGHMAPEIFARLPVAPVLNVLPALHLFMASALAMSFGASTVLTERRRLEARLKARTEAAQRARASAEAAEKRVTHLALHDNETGLPNRLGLEREVGIMLAQLSGRNLYVAALAIDRFAAIRTAIGSAQAAALTQQAASRLERQLQGAAVARLSVNCLGVALPAGNAAEFTALLNAARKTFATPLTVGASRVDIRFTAGLAGAPEHAGDARTLIERAQVALDQACAVGAELATFDDTAERAAASGLTLLSELDAGLENGGVWLAHQPKLDLRRDDWSGVECLIRWTHSDRGMLAPDTFIPLLEETGAINTITEWVLERALIEQAAMARAGLRLGMAINVSARSLGAPGFADRLAAVARRFGAASSAVTLEITETALMVHEDEALANMQAFRAAGFRLSIDDYGAGMSSLSYLKRIPADELKIDSSFVRGLALNKTDAMLVKSSIDLGHSLGLKVVAEGVEDAVALDLLRLFGCDYAQGYHIARPMPVTRLIEQSMPSLSA